MIAFHAFFMKFNIQLVWHVPDNAFRNTRINHHLFDICGISTICNYCHTRQITTTQERIILDACHTVRNRHARQASATIERIISNALHRVRYRHARQSGTIL